MSSLILMGYGEEFTYVGAKKCKKCHISKKMGAQYKVWAKMAHAKAFDTLASDESKKIAAAKGISDPQKSESCLKCHITGHGLDKKIIDSKFDITLGVQCESCHGPGSKHIIVRGKSKDQKKATGKPLPITKDEFKFPPSKEVCIKCHNSDSPTFKGFDFVKKFKEVSHLKPSK
ncbi:MAG: cytochrome C554 [Planctomycetes bacterium]|nr:cytochrome C554 [Planctomycetota bacterium]